MKRDRQPVLSPVEWYVLGVLGFIAAMVLGANLWAILLGCPA